MDAGQRVTLITETARLLESRNWTEVDLILDQFGLATTDQWSGGVFDYCVEMLRHSDDTSLRNVHGFLTGATETAPEAQPWSQNSLRLFASHLATEAKFLAAVRYQLSEYGIDAFVAHVDIEPSHEWQDVIEAALRTCHAATAFLHDGFPTSRWTDQEVGFLLARRVPVLPLIFDLDPYGFLGRLQGARCKGESATQVSTRIIRWLLKTPAVQGYLAEGLTSALLTSKSYDQTRKVVPLIQELPSLTPEQLERLDRAARDNQQVSDASVSWTPAPEIIKALIQRHGGPTFIAGDDPFSEEPPF